MYVELGYSWLTTYHFGMESPTELWGLGHLIKALHLVRIKNHCYVWLYSVQREKWIYSMSIKFIAVKCPECGATLDVEQGRTQLFCSFCGAKVIVSNTNERVYRKIDEARIKEAETEQAIRMRELQLEEAKQKQYDSLRRLLTYLWVGSIFVVIALCIYVWATDSLGGLAALSCLFYVGGPVVGGGAYLLFKVLPEKFK